MLNYIYFYLRGIMLVYLHFLLLYFKEHCYFVLMIFIVLYVFFYLHIEYELYGIKEHVNKR